MRCFVLTISDTRNEASDTSGAAIVESLAAAGHVVAGRKVVRDDPAVVANVVRGATVSADVIIATGGTGITSRDSTYEALGKLLDKRLDGFGELFRMLSYEQIGSGAILSRAVAGVVRGKLLFAMPGSTGGVRTGLEKILIPQLDHRHRPCNFTMLLPRIKHEPSGRDG